MINKGEKNYKQHCLYHLFLPPKLRENDHIHLPSSSLDPISLKPTSEDKNRKFFVKQCPYFLYNHWKIF